MQFDKKTCRNLLAVIIISILFYWGLDNYNIVLDGLGKIYSVFRPFVIGAAIAFILNLPMRSIETKLFKERPSQKPKTKALILKIKRPVSIVLTLLIISGVIFLVAFLVIPEFINTINIIKDRFPAFAKGFEKYVNQISELMPSVKDEFEALNINLEKIINSALSSLQDMGSSLISRTFSIATSVFSSLFNFVLGIIFAVYILISKEKLESQTKRIIKAYVPRKYSEPILNIAGLSYDIFYKFLGGQCTEALILGTLCFTGMSILNFPYALVIGALVALTALIPVVGGIIGAAVGAFLILVTDPIKALWFLIFIVILQQIEGNLIYPRVVGSSVGLPAMWVLLAVTVGGSIGNIIGMFVGVPVASVLYCIVRENVNKRNRI